MRREVSPEHCDIDWRRHGVVVALRGVDCAGLNGTEQLTLRHELVGSIKFDHHVAIGSLVEGVDRRLDDVLCKCRTRIGLEPPFDRALCPDIRRCKCTCTQRANGRQPGFLEKIAFVKLAILTHAHSPTLV